MMCLVKNRSGIADLGSCYISSPYGTNLEPLKKALEKHGCKLVVISDLVPSSAPLMESTLKNISKADIMIAILEKSAQNDYVFLEIGIAAALGKFVVTIVKPPMEVPAELRSFPYFRLDPENTRHLNQLIEPVIEGSKIKNQKQFEIKIKSKPKHRAPRVEAANYERIKIKPKVKILHFDDEEIKSMLDMPEIRVIDTIISVLAESGISTYTKSGKYNGPDIAAWSDDWQQSMGNPLLIEVKKDLPGAQYLSQVTDQFISYRNKGVIGPRQWFLVVYVHGPSSIQLLTHTGFPILFLKFEDLLLKIRDKSFVDIVKDLRNKVIHGI